MKTFLQTIKAVEQLDGKNAKLAALAGMSKDGQRLAAEALNPYRVFNTKKWKEPRVYAATDESADLFFKLLDALHDRTITGDTARMAVSDVLSSYTKETAAYLARVILKDLRCGCDTSSFNKVYPNLVPTFDVMLAGKVDEKYDWQFPVIAEVKYDGLRTIAIVENGKVSYLSRAGRSHEHLDGVFDDELVAIEKYIGKPFVMDGEVMADTFQNTVIAKGSSASKDGLIFWAFDFMNLQTWRAQGGGRKQTDRSEAVENILRKVGTKRVKKSTYKLCHNRADAKDMFDEVTKAGGEGLIIKKPSASYIWKRDIAWAKWKPVLDVDLKITGFYEGKGRLEGTLGGVYLEGHDENGKHIICECGSGFTDDDRKHFWANRPALLGKTMQLEAQEISKARDSVTHSLRFPVYIKIRTDK